MMRTHITPRLQKKKQARIHRIAFLFLFGLLFLSFGILGLTHHAVRIHGIRVSGNATVPEADILSAAEDILARRYLGFIPTDNILLLKRFTIKNHILNEQKKIASVSLSSSGLTGLEIHVAERAPETLWCSDTCYFMDVDGFVFAEAPHISGSPYNIYEGLIEGNPIGQRYALGKFSEFKNLFAEIKTLHLEPVRLRAYSDGEYEIILADGGVIRMNDRKTFAQNLLYVQTLINGGYVKTDADFLSQLQYIDVRFGNKPFFKLR